MTRLVPSVQHKLWQSVSAWASVSIVAGIGMIDAATGARWRGSAWRTFFGRAQADGPEEEFCDRVIKE